MLFQDAHTHTLIDTFDGNPRKKHVSGTSITRPLFFELKRNAPSTSLSPGGSCRP